MSLGAIVPYARTSVALSRWENMWQTFDFACQKFKKKETFYMHKIGSLK